MFKNPFSFKGRIGRLEYGISLLLISFVFILIVWGINNEFEYQDSELNILNLMTFMILLMTPMNMI